MKNLFLLLVIIGIAYFLWTQRTPEHQEPSVVEATSDSTPTPAATPKTKRNLAAKPRPTPEGMSTPAAAFYVLGRISITTDSGIVGIPAGTRVTLVSAGPPMRVTDGTYEFEVTPEQVMSDDSVTNKARGGARQLGARIGGAQQPSAKKGDGTPQPDLFNVFVSSVDPSGALVFLRTYEQHQAGTKIDDLKKVPVTKRVTSSAFIKAFIPNMKSKQGSTLDDVTLFDAGFQHSKRDSLQVYTQTKAEAVAILEKNAKTAKMTGLDW